MRIRTLGVTITRRVHTKILIWGYNHRAVNDLHWGFKQYVYSSKSHTSSIFFGEEKKEMHFSFYRWLLIEVLFYT